MKSSKRLFILGNFLIAITLIIYFIIVIPCLISNQTYLPNNSVPHYTSNALSDVGEKHSERVEINWRHFGYSILGLSFYEQLVIFVIFVIVVILKLFNLFLHADTMFVKNFFIEI